MKRLQITLDDELYAWLTDEIRELRFGSYSHAINYALKRLREEVEREKGARVPRSEPGS
jgi:Arc/MetJ-type ribon-helix-helix transcriptional regulator